jgi:hypothetical protein
LGSGGLAGHVQILERNQRYRVLSSIVRCRFSIRKTCAITDDSGIHLRWLRSTRCQLLFLSYGGAFS